MTVVIKNNSNRALYINGVGGTGGKGELVIKMDDGDYAPLQLDKNGMILHTDSINSRVNVRIINDSSSLNALNIADTSTVNFRGEEVTIEYLFKYINDLENSLADVHLASQE